MPKHYQLRWLSFCLVLLIFCFCAPLKKIKYPGRLTYQREFTVTIDRKKVVHLTRTWMKQTFGFITEEHDPYGHETGYIKTTGYTILDIGYFSLPCEFDLTLETADSNIRIRFDSFYLTYLDGSRDRLVHREGWESLQPYLEAISLDLYHYVSAYGEYGSELPGREKNHPGDKPLIR